MNRNQNPRNMLRGFFLVALLTSVALLPAGCRGGFGDSHQVGHVAPRTGPDQAVGRCLGEAVALVVDEANLDDASKVERRAVTVIHGDSGPTLDGFGFTATRLVSVNRVPVLIGAVNDDQLQRMVPAVQSRSIVLVTPSAGLIDTPTRLIYPVGLHPTERGKYLAKYAVDHLALTSVAIVCDLSTPVFTACRAGFETEFRHPDRHVTADWSFSDERERASLGSMISTSAPKALLFCGRASDLLRLRAALPSNPSPTILFAGEEEEPALRCDRAADGVVFVTAFTTRDPADKVQQFATDFRNRAGRPPEAIDALTGDAARVLLAGSRQARTFQREFLIKELPKVELDLPTGKFWYTKEGEARRTAYIMQIRQDSSELLKTYRPEKQ